MRLRRGAAPVGHLGIAGRHPGLPVPGGQIQPARAGGRHRERQPRPLHTPGNVAHLVRGVVHALVGDDVLAQQPVQQRDELAEVVGAFARRPGLLAERGGVEAIAAGADAEGDPAVADVVERDQFLGEGDRVPEVRRGDKGAEAHPGGDARRRGQRRHGAEPGPVAEGPPREVVIGVRGVEAQLLGALPHLPPAFGPAADGEYQGAQSHTPSVRASEGPDDSPSVHRTAPPTCPYVFGPAARGLMRATHRTPVHSGTGRWPRD